MLKIEKLSCERDDRLLFENLDMQVASGEVLQLKGPNGCGKTTLLRILSGLFWMYEGRVLWQERNISSCLPEYQQNLMFIGHRSGVKPTLTAIENLRFLMGMQQQCSENELMAALDCVGLAGFEHSYCRNLSAGQNRRVALARLYLSRARLWLLDEIFTAIDLEGVSQLENLLEEKANQGTAIVLTTHHRLSMAQVSVLEMGAFNNV